MLSDFMLCHPSGPFFPLNQNEWQKAVAKYPDLLKTDYINYIDYTATAAINVGGEVYFDNETILSQFQHLFRMLEFKTEYPGHQIDILTDNAKTHTARLYNIYDFGKSIGGRRPIDIIEYYDHTNSKKFLQCYFQTGPNNNESKGLLELAKQLNIQLPASCTLSQLRKLLSRHPAFEIVSHMFVFMQHEFTIPYLKTKLENLAKHYNVNIIHLPKFHCELNPIDGFWCNMKRFVRERNDQQYDTMTSLIEQSRERFIRIELYKKLCRRVWNACEGYHNGSSYNDVLRLYYGSFCKVGVVSHRRIGNN